MKTAILIALSLWLVTVDAKPVVTSQATATAVASAGLVPYDVKQADESFAKTVHGGIMHIVTKSADNSRQIKLIQEYLRQTAAEFSKGDFSSTERFHGSDMPGLAKMKAAKKDDIRYEYQALTNGGQIHFSTEYPALLTALHHWFDAQLKEHGSGSLPGHDQHHASPAE